MRELAKSFLPNDGGIDKDLAALFFCVQERPSHPKARVFIQNFLCQTRRCTLPPTVESAPCAIQYTGFTSTTGPRYVCRP